MKMKMGEQLQLVGDSEVEAIWTGQMGLGILEKRKYIDLGGIALVRKVQ
jgi:hypothetical protein